MASHLEQITYNLKLNKIKAVYWDSTIQQYYYVYDLVIYPQQVLCGI